MMVTRQCRRVSSTTAPCEAAVLVRPGMCGASSVPGSPVASITLFLGAGGQQIMEAPATPPKVIESAAAVCYSHFTHAFKLAIHGFSKA